MPPELSEYLIGQIGALYGRKRTSHIAEELGVSIRTIQKYAKRMGLRPVRFYKARTCKQCGRKWNPHVRGTACRSYARRCPTCFHTYGQRSNLEQQERAYTLYAQNIRPKDIAVMAGYTAPRGAWQGAMRYAKFKGLPWPVAAIKRRKRSGMRSSG